MNDHGVAASKSAGEILEAVVEDGREELDRASIFGGWLVALIAWLVAASRDTISQIFFIFSLAFLIPAAGLTHCVAGSSEFLISVFSGKESWAEYLGGFLLPTTLGNIVGGVVLVTLLNYGQVIGSKKKTSLSKVTDRG